MSETTQAETVVAIRKQTAALNRLKTEVDARGAERMLERAAEACEDAKRFEEREQERDA